MAYNGWTNYATWNVSLWIDNHEPWYRAKQSLLSRARGRIAVYQVARFYADVMGGTTPDLKRYRDDEPIDFGQIAESWEAERQEDVGSRDHG